MQNRQVQLRQTQTADLEYLFQLQQDKEATYLAAFTPPDHSSKEAYLEKFTRFLQGPTIHMLTILVDEGIAGSIAKFEIHGDAEITYWIGRSFWGEGIATAALKELLVIESTRPIFGRVAFDNIGSQKVLEKCGFLKIGTDKGFANARQTEVEEFIYKLS
ncbi:Protein N-acetyltransferase, RimJ/RimL family [Hymenobacter gelipurpurascens]|uniref:Protein N-acetyltransferase, RimJ/RimL family n=1 Tax=Hymenobacter gelipurpurascens TaxID=89968 RepID=A0A212T0B3_9BACT|nr:GNAT family N-acetyltransferase [Hymenobacter gelipurpurascens]SNC59468.1 Protein N-acetyltransferase, RimJ/RimL family [Hymenobacter gelipurpurascens]